MQIYVSRESHLQDFFVYNVKFDRSGEASTSILHSLVECSRYNHVARDWFAHVIVARVLSRANRVHAYSLLVIGSPLRGKRSV